METGGIILSSIVKPSLAAENPYRPSATVAFGKVTKEVLCQEDDIILNLEQGENYIEVAPVFSEMAKKYYVSNGQIIEKLPNTVTINKTEILANGADELIFSSVPPNTKIRVFQYIPEDYNVYDLLEGTDTFTTTIKTTYKIIVESFPYQDKEFIINAS